MLSSTKSSNSMPKSIATFFGITSDLLSEPFNCSVSSLGEWSDEVLSDPIKQVTVAKRYFIYVSQTDSGKKISVEHGQACCHYIRQTLREVLEILVAGGFESNGGRFEGDCPVSFF